MASTILSALLSAGLKSMDGRGALGYPNACRRSADRCPPSKALGRRVRAPNRSDKKRRILNLNVAIPSYPAAFWMAAVTAVLLLGVAKAGFAGGMGMLATPLVAITVGVAEAAAILLPLLITIDVLALFYYRRDFDRRSMKILIPGSLFGILCGTLFFRSFMGRDAVLRLGIGILTMVFVLFQMGRSYLFGYLEQHRPGRLEGLAMGALTGFTSTIAHAGGPPLTVYLLPQKFSKQIFVGTSAVFFAVTNAVKLIPYAGLGLLRSGNVTTVVLLAPLCYVGVRLGVYLNRRFSERWFTRLVYGALILSALELIWTGAAGI